MSPLEEVRIAMVGCGLIGGVHARCLRRAIDVDGMKARLVVAVDRDLERAERARGVYGFEASSTDAAGAIAREDVNAVWICTPTDAHEQLLDLALQSGRAVFCEKPLAHTARQSRAMAEAARAVPAQVGMVLRFSPLFLALRQMLGEDGIGRPMAAIFRDDQCLPVGGIYGSQWRSDLAVAGGGTVIEHSIHDLDLLRWYFGEVKSVWCTNAYFAGHDGIEDVASAVLRFESGLAASLVSVWHQMPHRRSDRRLEVFCERARLETVGDFHGTLQVERHDGRSERRDVGVQVESDFDSNAYLFENQAFLRALLSGQPPAPSLDEAVAAHRLVDALYESARSGQVVDI